MSTVDKEETYIQNICQCFQKDLNTTSREYLLLSALPQITELVQHTSRDAEYRLTVSTKTQWEKHLAEVLNVISTTDFSTLFLSNNTMKLDDANSEVSDLWALYLRILRGYIMLCRNLIAVSGSAVNFDSKDHQDLHLNMLQSFASIYKCANFPESNKKDLYITMTEFLCNLTTIGSYTLDHTLFFGPCIQFLSFAKTYADSYVPWCIYLTNLSSKNQDFLYYSFKNELFNKDVVVGILLRSSILRFDSKTWDTTNMTTLQTLYIKLWYVLITHESFPNFFYALETEDYKSFEEILEISTVIVSSKEAWDNFELTNVMIWVFKIFDELIGYIDEYFQLPKASQHTSEPEKNVEQCYNKLLSVLDIMSSLCKYDHIRKFLHFYKGLEKLIKLLGILEKNCVKLNLVKSSEGSDVILGVKDNQGLDRVDLSHNRIKANNFPHCKSLIIEIISYLAYGNREVQNKVRELCGLEIILSNCIIDDSEPFIKERSIVCLRYLLTENKENQDFVAKLEAQKPVQDSVLDEAGFELEINDEGKVGLKKRKL
ncbi:hypothetical protein ACO0QE_003759 [Hanseniaspora vineae]